MSSLIQSTFHALTDTIGFTRFFFKTPEERLDELLTLHRKAIGKA